MTDPPLTADDIVGDSKSDPQVVTVHLRRSKTDPVAKYIWATRVWSLAW